MENQENTKSVIWDVARIVVFYAPTLIVGLFLIVYGALERDWEIVGLGVFVSGVGGAATANVPSIKQTWKPSTGGKYGA